jgi:hypothetical protein
LSIVAHLPDDERREALEELRSVLPEGAYRFPMRTDVTWTVRDAPHTSAPVS